MKLTDKIIIRGILEGNERIITAFFLKIAPGIIAYLCKNSGEKGDVYDVFNIALLRAKKNLKSGKYKDKGNFSGYFFTISKWYWSEELRRRKKNGHHQEWNDNIILVENYEKHTEEVIVKNRQLEKMRIALKQISPKCQETIKLRLLGIKEKPFAEVAEDMGLVDDNTPKEIAKKEIAKLRVNYQRCIERMQKLIAKIQ